MPIIDIQRRLHQAGRIRLGDKVATKSGAQRPSKLSSFRFTSSDKESLDQVSATYGGDVVPWDGNGSGDKYELYTNATTLNVLVPPVELAFSQYYEDWTSGVCRHRCDGVEDIKTDHPCACDPENRTCKPTTRLGVILQEVSGIGTWRLETHGWAAAAEIGGTIGLLQALQTTKPVPARLLLREDTRKSLQPDGSVQTHNFVVPVLDPILSIAQLTGGAAAPQLASGVTPIPSDTSELPSVADQVRESSIPVERPKRANAAAPLPPTGLKPQGYIPQDDEPVTPVVKPSSNGPLLTEPQGRMIARLFNKLEVTERQDRLDMLQLKLGHPFTSSKELTKREASDLISMLKADAGEEDTPKPPAPRSSTPREKPPAEPFPYEPQDLDGSYDDQGAPF